MSDASGRERTYSLSEVAEGLGIPTYRLRSWENFYPVFKSVRSENGQPYYTESDIAVIRRIAELLYKDGRKSHEIMPILREELGHIVTDSKFKPGEKAQLTEELAKENEQLRQEIEKLQTRLNEVQQNQTTIESELSETVSILGQENARLQALVKEGEKTQEAFHQAGEEIARLKDDLGYANEVHAHDEEKLAHYQTIESENEQLKQEIAKLSSHQDQKRAVAQDQEIERLRLGFKMILAELDGLKKTFISG
ncbi:MerR family transcriptional regulator [Acetobacteraceae bacterium ESL0709]|nr:MerR family transcriptional regulator [Acetobacteraceae bacterium ESL0697]MDF7678344.1 MerR family transcriptional regulator [Acetobacteraceae bacterium ESL0709]